VCQGRAALLVGPWFGMTELEYQRTVNHLSDEVLGAIEVFYSLEELERLAIKEPEILKAINEDAGFWMVHRACLQTTLFVTLNRVLDQHPGSCSMEDALAATLGHLEFFSRKALSARRKEEPDPDWFQAFLNAAWIPTKPADLRHLKKAFKPHAARIRATYLPIRHQYYAHRSADHSKFIPELFKKTNRIEMAQTLDFLHDLTDALWGLYQNGEEPRLGVRTYKDHNRYIREQVSRVLRKIAP